jgi:curli biogenesis system outer membrane secretion channel CsgG
MRTLLLPSVAAAVTLALGGCGSDEQKSTTAAKPASTGTAPLDTVLDCLKVGGLDAKNQSTSTGEKIGIDYPSGRLVVSFEKSVADAEAYASVAKTNGETAVVKGTVAITVPADPHAEADQPAVEECVTGG